LIIPAEVGQLHDAQARNSAAEQQEGIVTIIITFAFLKILNLK